MHKIGIIGDGRVGSCLAYTLFLQGDYDIKIVDKNFLKAKADALDIDHIKHLKSGSEINACEYKDLKECEVIIITASVRLSNVTSRNDFLKGNLDLLKSILDEIKPNIEEYTKILLISNPVDALTYFTYRYLNIPKNRVIGSGTYLDSLRFSYYLGQELHIDPVDINSLVIGEHGFSEVPLFSSVKINNIDLMTYLDINNLQIDFEKIKNNTIQGGFLVANDKGFTNYAVCYAVSAIVFALVNKKETVLPVSSYNEDYKTYLSLPSEVNEDGVNFSSLPYLTPSEKQLLEKSIESLKENQEIVDKYL